MKTHLVYGSIIILLLGCLGYVGTTLYVSRVFRSWPDTQYRLTVPIDLIDPLTKQTVATLQPGTTIRGPQLHDLSDTDLGDNNRFKILVDLDPEMYDYRMQESVQWPQYVIKKANE